MSSRKCCPRNSGGRLSPVPFTLPDEFHRACDTAQFYNFRSRKSASVVRNIPSGDLFGGLTTSPDGRTILYAKRDAAVAELMLVDNFR